MCRRISTQFNVVSFFATYVGTIEIKSLFYHVNLCSVAVHIWMRFVWTEIIFNK